jgi:polyphosphate kinase
VTAIKVTLGSASAMSRNVNRRLEVLPSLKRIHIVMTSHCYSVDTGFASKVRASLPDTDLEYVLEWDDSYDDLWAGGVVSE